MNNRHLQRGLSMIELMVALAISSFLIVGVTQIYIDNKRSYTFQQSQSENQEGARYSLIFLQQELAKAGYRRRPDEPIDSAFKAENLSGCNFAAGQTVMRISASSVCIRYQPRDSNDRDCQGNAVATAADFTSPYTKSTENFVERIWFDSANNNLVCTRQAGTTTKDAIMMSGLADLRFVFGVGSAASPRNITQYTASPTTTQPILAVRFITLTRSSSNYVRDASTADNALQNWKDYSGATAAEVTALKNADKSQLYQFSQNTVTLRNLTP